MTRSWVHQLVNAWQRIAIPRASLVQISEVHTHPPFAVSLLDHHHINQPVWVINFSDKFCCGQLLNFFFNGIISFRANSIFFWHTSLEEEYTFKRWVMTLGWILGMSSWLHANTSILFFKNWTRSCFVFFSILVPIFVSFSGLFLPKEMSSNTSVGSTTILLSSMVIVYMCSSIANMAK